MNDCYVFFFRKITTPISTSDSWGLVHGSHDSFLSVSAQRSQLVVSHGRLQDNYAYPVVAYDGIVPTASMYERGALIATLPKGYSFV